MLNRQRRINKERKAQKKHVARFEPRGATSFWPVKNSDPNLPGGINPFESEADQENQEAKWAREYVDEFEAKVAGGYVPQSSYEMRKVKEMQKIAGKHFAKEHLEQLQKAYRKCFEQWILGKHDVLNDKRVTKWSYSSLAEQFPRAVNFALQKLEHSEKIQNYLFGLWTRGPQSELEVEKMFKYLVYPVEDTLREFQLINNDPSLGLDDLHAGEDGKLEFDGENYLFTHPKNARMKWPPALVMYGAGRRKDSEVPLALDPTVNKYMRPSLVSQLSYRAYIDNDFSALSPDIQELWEVANDRGMSRKDREINPRALQIGQDIEKYDTMQTESQAAINWDVLQQGDLMRRGVLKSTWNKVDPRMCRPVAKKDEPLRRTGMGPAQHQEVPDDEESGEEDEVEKPEPEKDTSLNELTDAIHALIAIIRKNVEVEDDTAPAASEPEPQPEPAPAVEPESPPKSEPVVQDSPPTANIAGLKEEDEEEKKSLSELQAIADEVVAAADKKEEPKEKPPITGDYDPKEAPISLDDYKEVHEEKDKGEIGLKEYLELFKPDDKDVAAKDDPTDEEVELNSVSWLDNLFKLEPNHPSMVQNMRVQLSDIAVLKRLIRTRKERGVEHDDLEAELKEKLEDYRIPPMFKADMSVEQFQRLLDKKLEQASKIRYTQSPAITAFDPQIYNWALGLADALFDVVIHADPLSQQQQQPPQQQQQRGDDMPADVRARGNYLAHENLVQPLMQFAESYTNNYETRLHNGESGRDVYNTFQSDLAQMIPGLSAEQRGRIWRSLPEIAADSDLLMRNLDAHPENEELQ